MRDPRAPTLVTISCSIVRAHAAHSATVGSPSQPGPKTVTRSPGRSSASPVSTTTMSIENLPTSGRRRPRTSTSARPDAARGSPSA